MTFLPCIQSCTNIQHFLKNSPHSGNKGKKSCDDFSKCRKSIS